MKKVFKKLLGEIKTKNLMLSVITQMNGSAPRGAGAMMLCDSNGIIAGTVGGGPAEGACIDLSKSLITKKQSQVKDFGLFENKKNDVGAVCGGEISVFLQFIEKNDASWEKLVNDILLAMESRTKKTLEINLDGSLPTILDEDIKCSKLEDNKFSIPIPIGEKVYIFGAGHCSKALAPILSSVGFSVSVMDDRSELMTKENFPTADELIIEDYKLADEILDVGEDDYIVIMTAGHAGDYILEERLIRRDPAYIGVIGSKSKIAYVNEKLRNDGVSEDRIARVHTPIGIKIHSITPEEVAVSIAAEMIKERYEIRQKNGLNNEKGCMG